ncbi:LysR family transcriptional regulator [Reinekea marinisedimentorum]|uniref:DNA-binding transcriptional LysR family regulator n=1 Tax=Reinekea marinisedimentorum TaxID=230495 RepID=A0A4R3I8U8_9GAMM|nr:LysR family transcriptional regulator [Reinekea marinisedimentorum]TCS41436.1 DNA-binding transcriptional LysR family regulator [Reinekea marinisedimentorum]
MDLQSLETFMAVAELGSFSAAGEKLFLTQPAISKRIANLEALLNASLFDRIGREVTLTEAGKLLQEKAQNLIHDMREVQSSVSQLNEKDVRSLSLASSHHIGLHYLGPLLREFANQNPLAKLDLKFMESEQAIASLLQRKIELVLTTIPSPLPKELAAQVIWKDNLQFVVSHDHPLAQRKSIRLNELTFSNAILPEPGTTTYKIIEQTFHKHHIPLKRVIHVNYLETIQSLVSNGLGWSLLPETMINSQLVQLNVDRVELNRNLGIITHKQRTLSNGARVFCQLIEQANA